HEPLEHRGRTSGPLAVGGRERRDHDHEGGDHTGGGSSHRALAPSDSILPRSRAPQGTADRYGSAGSAIGTRPVASMVTRRSPPRSRTARVPSTSIHASGTSPSRLDPRPAVTKSASGRASATQ